RLRARQEALVHRRTGRSGIVAAVARIELAGAQPGHHRDRALLAAAADAAPHAVDAVEHHHVRLDGLERLADARELKVALAAAAGPILTHGADWMVDDQEPLRAGRSLGRRFGAQQPVAKAAGGEAGEEVSTLERIRRHDHGSAR